MIKDKESFILSKRDKESIKWARKKLAKITKSLKPDCPWCGIENGYEQYQGRHTPFTIYICKGCKKYFSLSFSLVDGRITRMRKGCM